MCNPSTYEDQNTLIKQSVAKLKIYLFPPAGIWYVHGPCNYTIAILYCYGEVKCLVSARPFPFFCVGAVEKGFPRHHTKEKGLATRDYEMSSCESIHHTWLTTHTMRNPTARCELRVVLYLVSINKKWRIVRD